LKLYNQTRALTEKYRSIPRVTQKSYVQEGQAIYMQWQKVKQNTGSKYYTENKKIKQYEPHYKPG
jgi:hypothetical protein